MSESPPRLLTLSEFIDFISGITGDEQTVIIKKLKELIIRKKPMLLNNGYMLIFIPEKKQIQLVKEGIIQAVYTRD